MSKFTRSVRTVLLFAALSAAPVLLMAVPTTTFIQGKLERADQTALTGSRAYRVRVFDAQLGGNQVGLAFTGVIGISATGRFSIPVDLPDEALRVASLWYELGIDSAATADGTIDAADVFPNRVQVASVPYALRAAKAEEVATTNSTPIQMSIDGFQVGQIVRTINDDFNITFGAFNGVDPSSQGGVIGGGSSNRVFEDFGTVSGGFNNSINDLDSTTTVHPFGFIGGGTDNTVRGYGDMIGGGQGNVASGTTSAIAGGFGNGASGSNAFLGGGTGNFAGGDSSTIAGGRQNHTFDNNGTIGGGFTNQTGTDNANASDTINSTVGGGSFNIASGLNSTVSGGDSNAAQSDYSTVPGGQGNVAFGQYSFAAGRRAHANNNGTFVWSDNFNSDFTSTADNQFLIRANGGVGINNSAPLPGTLDVSGDIKFSGAIAGNVARTGTTAGLRILRGVVDGTTVGTSSILEGDGFTCVRAAVGSYNITYSTAFKSGTFPSISGTAFGVTAFAIIGSSASTSVNIQFKNTAGANVDPTFFHFIAIGQ